MREILFQCDINKDIEVIKNIFDEEVKQMSKDETMKFCIEMAKQGVDLEQLFKDLKPIFDIAKQVSELAIKNYKFLTKKEVKSDEN